MEGPRMLSETMGSGWSVIAEVLRREISIPDLSHNRRVQITCCKICNFYKVLKYSLLLRGRDSSEYRGMPRKDTAEARGHCEATYQL